MTVSQTAALIGQQANLPIGGGVMVAVLITDVKEGWGKTRYQVTPVKGYGAKWVEYVELIGQPE